MFLDMAEGVTISSLDLSSQVSEALNVPLNDRRQLEQIRANYDSELGELEKGDKFAEQAHALWVKFADETKEALGKEKCTEVKVLASVLAGTSGRLGREVLRFEKPYVVASFLKLDQPELDEIHRMTNDLLKKYRIRKGETIGNRLKSVCSVLPDKAREKFVVLVGHDMLDLRSSFLSLEYDDIETAKKVIVLELANKSLQGEIELSESQTIELNQLIDYISHDVDHMAVSDAISELSIANMPVPESLEKAEEEHEKRLTAYFRTEIEKLLLPHQKQLLKNAAIQLFLTHNKAMPFRWPALLADELQLNEKEKKTLEESTEKESAEFEKQTKQIADDLVEEIPAKFRSLLERYEALEKSGISLEDLIKKSDSARGKVGLINASPTRERVVLPRCIQTQRLSFETVV